MHKICAHCDLTYEREPGYFLGSIYVNYGVTALLITAGWITMQFAFGFPPRTLLFPFLAFCVIFQTLFFRYARALWLAMDCRFDQSLFDVPPPEAPRARR